MTDSPVGKWNTIKNVLGNIWDGGKVVGKFVPSVNSIVKGVAQAGLNNIIDAGTVAYYNRKTRMDDEFKKNLTDMFQSEGKDHPKVVFTDAQDNLKGNGKYTFQVRGFSDSPFIRLKKTI